MGFFDRFRNDGQSSNPGGPAPGVPPVQNGSGADPQQIQQLVQQFLQGKPAGDATMTALKNYLATQGIQIEIPTHAGGSQSSDDKIVLPGGQVIDLYGDAGGANTVQWAPDGYWVDGRPSSTPGTWTDPNMGESNSGLPPGFSLTGQNGLASFNAPGLLAPWTEEFQKPDPNNMAASPSFQWNMSRGLDALEKFHGAKGTLNAGGAGKDSMEFASGLASAEYDKDWNRNLNLYGMNRDTFWGNQGNAFNKLNATTGLGAGAAGDYANNVSSLYQNSGAYNAQNSVNQSTNYNNLAGSGLDSLFAWLAQRNRQNGGGVDATAG